ncbi:hypothetical protein Pelo_18241 [Pelomyxa schiedti]|nr:hypothetical protein Pelo_18241 [Pelomyxa schiedti]
MQANKTSSSLSASSTHQAPSCEAEMERELSDLPQDIQAMLMEAPFGRDARATAASTTTTTATTTSTSAASGSSSSSTLDPDNNTTAAASSASSSSSCATSTSTSTSTTTASASLGHHLTPTISTITPAAALAEGARVAETSEDPIGTQESLTNNASSEDKSAVPSHTTTAASADNSAETRMTSTSTGVTTLVEHVTTTKPNIEGIYLREQMLSLLAGTLPRCGSASALRVLTPSLLYSVFIWARASEKRLVIVLRTSTGQGTPEERAPKLGLWQDAGVISSELEVNPVWRYPEEPWLVTWAGEDHYVVHQKNGPGTPSIFKLRNVQRPGDSRVLLVIPTPPPRAFHCRTNSHWVLYHYGAEPKFYVEPALLPPTPPQIGSASSSSSLLKIQQEELGLSEGHVISLVALSKREPHLALLISHKVNANGTQAEYDILFWNVKKSVESKRFHEIERWPVTGMEALQGESIRRAFVIRSGSPHDDCNLGDDAVVVVQSARGRVYVIKRKSPSAPHLVQSAGSEVRNLFPIGNGTKFCITYDGRYETRDVNTPENVLMTVDTRGFISVQWETNTGLMLAMSEKKKVVVVPTGSDNSNNNSDTIQHIDVRNVEDNRPLFILKLIQRWRM